MFGQTILLSIALGLTSASDAPDVHTRGWLEHARVMPNGLLMRAKLDSGAKTTSIHAEILPAARAFEAAPPEVMLELLSDLDPDALAMLSGDAPDDPPEGEIAPIFDMSMDDPMPETITFKLTSRRGKEVIFTEPVVRWVSIRRRGGGTIVRPVVNMDLCIGGIRVNGEVNLADRTGFNYPLLIGRNMLSEAGIAIDSRKIFAARKACPPIRLKTDPPG
jgi:hypothetical protein